MTSFDTDLASRGWALISEGAQMISLAYAAVDTPAARAGEGAGGATGSPSPAPAYDVPPGRPWIKESELPTAEPALKPQVDAGLAICPIHGIPWVVKAAGVSKAGKRYSAFWKCNQRDGDTFCDEKPQRIWVDLHPPVEGSVAA